MPYCHILSAYFASQGIDITAGHVEPLVEFDRINMRQLKLAQIGIDAHQTIYWKRDRGGPAQDEEGDEVEAQEGEQTDIQESDESDAEDPYSFVMAALEALSPAPQTDPAVEEHPSDPLTDYPPDPPRAPTVEERLSGLETRLTRHEEMVLAHFERLEHDQTTRHQDQTQRIDRLTGLVERLVSRFSPPPPPSS